MGMGRGGKEGGGGGGGGGKGKERGGKNVRNRASLLTYFKHVG